MRYRRLTSRYVRLVPIREALSYADVLRALAPLTPVAPRHWRPAADVCETAAAIAITLDVAGVDEEAVDIGLYEDALVVEGARRVEGCGSDGFYHAAEIRQGPFRIEVMLPADIDADRVVATYERGLLRIDLPKLAARAAGDLRPDDRTREGAEAPDA